MRCGAVAGVATLLVVTSCAAAGDVEVDTSTPPILTALPSPDTRGTRALEEVLAVRRSVRSFAPRPLTAGEIGQLLWAAQGVTGEAGGRTAPSAGALYPLELYVATADGISHYRPPEHALELITTSDRRAVLAAAGFDQEALTDAAAIFVITAIPSRTETKYGTRAERYVQLEAGHAAQNLLLQAVALELGAVPIGSFDDDRVASVLALPADAVSLYLIPVGEPAD